MDATFLILAVLLGLAGLAVGVAVGSRGRKQAVAERDAAAGELGDARLALATAHTEVDLLKANIEERRVEREKADEARRQEREQLENQLKGLTAQALKDNREQLVKQAQQLFDEKHKQSNLVLKGLVNPVGEQLNKLERQVQELEQKREGAYQKLSTQVGSLGEAATHLRDVLKSSSMRGNWGEIHLRKVLEISGMRDRVDFDDQPSYVAGDKTKRPDAVVHLPRDMKVVIDAKTPLEAYMEALNTNDEDQQSSLLKAHAQALLGHAKTLGERDYSGAVDGSPDFVVMYVPSDPILDAAMDTQPALWDEAWRKHHVLIATPGLLLALLSTVALAWQRQDMQQNAQKIAEAARTLVDRLGSYGGHVNEMGKRLEAALDHYNKSVRSWSGYVMPQARRIEKLGAFPENARIDLSARGTKERTVRYLDAQSGAAPKQQDKPDGNGLPPGKEPPSTNQQNIIDMD